MLEQKYPLSWKKKKFSIKIFCSIPNIATGILLKAGDTSFIIDPGDGILRDLNKEIGVKNLLGISQVFVSHGHHDHVGGVWSLLTYLRVMQKKTPLTIYYPNECVEIESIFHAFEKVYSHSITYKIVLKAIKKTNSFVTKKVTVKPFPVIHKEHLHTGGTRQVPALGYNFSFNGMTICYGGDTAYCEDLVKHAKGVDLAVLEAGHDEETPDEMHMTMKEAVSIGKSAKKYFLVHVPE
ncbi:MAG: MBL fold metallo-hydrolase [Ignavibacteria bacterium]|nr:MBL fold metallo-hydrolase [Ignavibacteria bacterium]MBT8383457.1 MBL fold metallo-hydrolase [Ignavibacteria bacterium]MBT8390626.1 MBL fold metallo-hydrolase [Ignavibacteria bacterium]NNJ52669.1 MBL fold metallo-hydrolase [Ignavibacteriaceae bacterium]NNL21868.1 MBL fold metallo-hydrolase [Ignavibacteriaceae bacterium]